ncbi:cell division protein ZapA [Novosphingobium mangrovi (ex Huang et al. 2023)]|uniref:Cell division protein ZapA n=1 Tax=Novosphingobium mangrovi (ex Huang et al. 2023) TaxID=2976432 RepID=A0ABT2I8C1_9SPHN|nr:cell division protein ZapA [Novosphingobium mangrovi (ex Huang et al. 2023)]MCT2401033.1 cell division protein ZapA [Novosphingobium mangrovi (ex Huang et al. 2023)]
MSNVTLSIGGRSFTVACADGEEDHVAGLGKLIDDKVSEAGATGQTETRMLLYAALLLADEVHDLQGRKNAGAVPSGLAARLVTIAERIENLADLLESDASNA